MNKKSDKCQKELIMNKRNLLKARQWWRENKALVVIGSFAVIAGTLEIWMCTKWPFDPKENKTEVLKSAPKKEQAKTLSYVSSFRQNVR